MFFNLVYWLAFICQRTEKEWDLQLKNMELKKKVDELSKKLNLLEKEASGVSNWIKSLCFCLKVLKCKEKR